MSEPMRDPLRTIPLPGTYHDAASMRVGTVKVKLHGLGGGVELILHRTLSPEATGFVVNPANLRRVA